MLKRLPIRKSRSCNVSLTSEELLYGPKLIYITIAKSSFTVFDNMIFDSGYRADVICFDIMASYDWHIINYVATVRQYTHLYILDKIS